MKIVIIIKSRVKAAVTNVVEACIKYLYDSTVLSDSSSLCD